MILLALGPKFTFMTSISFRTRLTNKLPLLHMVITKNKPEVSISPASFPTPLLCVWGMSRLVVY